MVHSVGFTQPKGRIDGRIPARSRAYPAPGSYHWTPRLQREFLEAFATNGSVKISAAKVSVSPAAVYQLGQRPEGAAFRPHCAAALPIARAAAADGSQNGGRAGSDRP